MSNYWISAISFFLPALLNAQVLRLDLESAIRQAQDSSIVSYLAKQEALVQGFTYDVYKAGKGPQVSLNLIPSYNRQNHNIDYNYVSPSNVDLLSAAASVNYSQQLSSLGGYLYADSRLVWSDYFNSTYKNGNTSLFGTTPLRVGYKQELIGWNGFKWEDRIREQRRRTAMKALSYDMLAIAQKTAIYYFDYIYTEQSYRIYEQNYYTADTLFRIGQRKFDITTITKEELNSLELEKSNALRQYRLAEANLSNSRLALLSFLHLTDTGQDISLAIPQTPPVLNIDHQQSIDMALSKNPDLLTLYDNVLEAEYRLEEAKHRKGLNVGMDISVGIHNYSSTMPAAYSNPGLYSLAQMSFTIPLYDGGLSKKRISLAESSFRKSEYAAKEEARAIEESVRKLINAVETQQQLIGQSREDVILADETFAMIGRDYADGLLDMNTYQFALKRKDDTHRVYLELLSGFWENYYALCTITMYDYINEKELR